MTAMRKDILKSSDLHAFTMIYGVIKYMFGTQLKANVQRYGCSPWDAFHICQVLTFMGKMVPNFSIIQGEKLVWKSVCVFCKLGSCAVSPGDAKTMRVCFSIQLKYLSLYSTFKVDYLDA